MPPSPTSTSSPAIVLRNARSVEPSPVYFGEFGGVQAAVSLQWLDQTDSHISGGTKLIATGALRKIRSGDIISWVGRISRGESVRIARTLQRKPAHKILSNYRSKVGSSEVRIALNWSKDRRVTQSQIYPLTQLGGQGHEPHRLKSRRGRRAIAFPISHKAP